MEKTSQRAGVCVLLAKILAAIAVSAALVLVPGRSQAQPPPGQGDCKACTPGMYCVDNPHGQTCYTNATFCSDGAEWGWDSCDDDPPYGECTVEDYCAGDQFALVSIPDGLTDLSPGALFIAVVPCSAARSRGAVAHAVSIGTHEVASKASAGDGDIIRAWLPSL